jgi:dipeptidase E
MASAEASTAIRLLLASSSRVHGSGWLDPCADEIRAFLAAGRVRRALFVPHALKDRDAYAKKARERLTAIGLELDSLHEAPAGANGAREAVAHANAFVVGGGNTFRLLLEMHALRVLEPMRARIEAGTPYVGWSAGSNLACPTIRTTNDMPIVEPPTLTALGVLPFQLNPHYVDADPASKHMGETREERIAEFHEENAAPVLGLREGAILRRKGSELVVKGVAGARLFRRGRPPEEIAIGARLDGLLS